MARSKKQRIGFLRRYTWKLLPAVPQADAMRRHARMLAVLWNSCLQRNEDAYRRLSHAKQEWWWKPYDEPRKRRDGTLIEGRYVRRHLAHADWLYSYPPTLKKIVGVDGKERMVNVDPKTRKLTGDEKLELFGTDKTHLNLFDFSPEITAVRRELPEYQELSGRSMLRTAKKMEEAFKRFFDALKKGGEAGSPRYRATAKASQLPHDFTSGCKLRPSARQRTSDEPVRHWRITLKGVPGSIRAFGECPEVPQAWCDADIRCAPDGTWWLSIAVEVKNRRGGSDHPPETPARKLRPAAPTGPPVTVRFDLVDALAQVDGAVDPVAAIPPSFGDLEEMQRMADDLKSERDRRWPIKPGQKLSRRRRLNREVMDKRIAALSARIARIRRERLHEWTTAIQRQSSAILIVAPAIRQATQSAKGDETSWGAAVKAVASVNRHILSQAPASAIAMLQYKAKEAGISVDLIEDQSPAASLGHRLSKASKSVRKARRSMKKEEEMQHG